MSIIKKILRQPLSEDELVNCFDDASRSILSLIQQKSPFYTKLFPIEDLPILALDSFRPVFHEVSKTKNRKLQSRRLLAHYFVSKQEEVCMQYFSSESPDMMVVTYVRSLIDGGCDDFLINLSLKIDSEELSHEKFIDIVKAYFKRNYYLEIYKNTVFLTVIQTLYGKIDDQADLQRYELIINEHIKKLGVELLLKYSKEDALFSTLSENYDFSETKRRSDLIAAFIQGVELNSIAVIDKACSEFIEVLQENYEKFSAIKNSIELSYE